MTNLAVQNEVFKLYYELGITEPSEIDLEAIAFYKDAVVKRRPLTGCEARIIGVDSRAIITVNEKSSLERQNFSIGHELGHWFKDRGKIGNLCSKSDMDESCGHKMMHNEKVANSFASELIMPSFMMKKLILGRPFTLDSIREIKSQFCGSFIVTLRRLITMDTYMGFFASYDRKGNRNYFNASPSLPGDFFPPRTAPVGSAIHTLLSQNKDPGPTIVDGNIWCRDDLANDTVVHEHAFHYFEDEFLTLVWWQDDEPIWRHMEQKDGL